VNSHIRRLAGEALDRAVPQTWTTLTAYDLNKFTEVFAELMVRECASQVIEHQPRYLTRGQAQEMANTIKDHFGVKS